MAGVVVRRCGSYRAGELKLALASLFDGFGGVGAFAGSGESVLLKPNLLAADRASAGTTTHPKFVAAAAELFLDFGLLPVIGDSPAFGSCRQAAAKSGLLPEARRLGVEVVELKRNISMNGAKLTGSLKDYPTVVNLPKLKAHSQLGFTCGVKNLFGLVAGKKKAVHHLLARGSVEEFAGLILKVAMSARPRFTAVDAIDVMTKTGPRRGVMRPAGLILGGEDPIAVDAAAAEIFGIPNTPILDAARSMGLEAAMAGTVRIEGMDGQDLPLEGFEFPGRLDDVSFSVPRVALSVLRHLAALFRGG